MISVLVVDDSVVVRRLIVDALGEAPGIQVVGTAANGLLAQAKIDQLKPDVVTMDIEMPQMDGIEAVRELRKRHAHLPVIMFSTLSAAGATATLEALSAGATDYVTKPSNVGSVQQSIAAVREQLVPKIQALGGRRRPAPGGPPA
ncbi:response regulator, partial [Actinoplanes sp. NPDC024001]|uniref:response regulator n=1 Tax=Actinoplanes sp. NPDC024001 TaxID=3154598 RepID=UPI0033D399C3